MLEVKLESIVYTLVDRIYLSRDEFTSKARDDNKALYLNFDVSLSYYENGKKAGVRKGLHLVYYAPFGRYVTVFSAVTDSCFAKCTEVKDWKHEITHDSCWRNLEIFSTLYFNSAKDINDQLEESGMKSVRPVDMNQNVFINDELYRFINVEVSRDPADERGYRKILKVL